MESCISEPGHDLVCIKKAVARIRIHPHSIRIPNWSRYCPFPICAEGAVPGVGSGSRAYDPFFLSLLFLAFSFM